MKYRWHTRPYAHQIRAVKFLLSTGFGGALLMEPRTGKTKIVIDYLAILAMQHKIDRAIVVAPNRVTDVWVEQIHQHTGLNVSVTVWDASARRTHRLPTVNPAHDLTVVVVNYEAFATPGRRLKSGRRSKSSGRFKHRQVLLRWCGDGSAACILDESHKIKSPSGKAANMLVSMGKHFDFRVLMTGTVVTKAKRVHDVYMQWKFLNPSRLENMGLYTVEQVKEYTGKWIKDNGFPQWVRAKEDNLEELRREIHKDSFSITRAECYDMPDALPDNIIWCPITGRTAKAYDDLAREMVAELEHNGRMHTVEASIKLVQALRLAQITGGVVKTDEGRLLRIGQHKLKRLKELIEDECLDKEEKIVVAARFKADLNAITRLGRSLDLPVYELRGGVTRAQGTANRLAFQRHDGPAMFVMQPSSGSLGIDLSSSGHMIWYSFTTSYVDFSQANDRIALHPHARQYTYLMVPNTVDTMIYQAMQDDGDVAKLMTTRPKMLLRKS